MDIVVYHNPRCSKSRATLELLESRGLQARIVRYLDIPPEAATLAAIAAVLDRPAREMLRTGEQAWTELGLDPDTLTDSRLFELLAENPTLLQRPIVVANGQARIGRPPEAVLEIIERH